MDPLDFLLTRADPITWLLLIVFIARQGVRLAKLERVQAALVKGHTHGREAHADLVKTLPKAEAGQ